MKTVMTLSDRLKLAGIREYKPQPSVKPTNNLNKSFKKRKSNFKITTVDKHRNRPLNAFLKDSKKNQALKSKKVPLENTSHSSPDSNNNVKKSAEETLYISLDFIKDCQKYKKKFRKSKEDLQLNNQEKRMSDFYNDCKQYHVKKEDSQTFLKKNSHLWVSKGKELKSSCKSKDSSFHQNKYTKLDVKETNDVEFLNSTEETAEILQKIEPLINKLSLEEFAKIDKKYLEFVISLANLEPSKNKNLEKGEIGEERTKKSIGKTFCNNEAKNKQLGGGNSTNGGKISSTKKMQSTSNSSSTQLQKDQTSARIFRDSTKSEVQIQLRDKKTIGGQRNSEEIKIEKEAVHTKSELSDGHKKIKPWNKILKSNNKEVIEIPFSIEVSKAKDVKELWRRETKKKSENSLTSHSSCTIPESDENPKWKNLELQSYKILHKLVEEEINKISKKPENKNNTREVKNKENNTQKVLQNKSESLKGSLRSKNIFNKLKLPSDENPAEEKALLVKNKLRLPKNLQNHSTYEGEKNKSELLSIFSEDLVSISKGELKLSDKKKKKRRKKKKKVPDQTIENWSILNRLEQAFLALGSSNFQNESTRKIKQDPKNNPTQNYEIPEKVSEKVSEEQKKIKSQNQTTHGTLSNRKTLKPLSRARLSNNESVPSKKTTGDAKFPSVICSSIQSREKNKRNETFKAEPSNVLDQSEKAKESLIRKKTFNVISLKDPSVIQPQKSNIFNKTDSKLKSDNAKKHATQMTKQEPQEERVVCSSNGHSPTEEEEGIDKRNSIKRNGYHSSRQKCEKRMVKNKPLSRSKSIEKREEKTKLTVLKSQVKPVANEKIPQSQENPKIGISKLRINQKQKRERAMPVEEILQHQMPQKKELRQKSMNKRPVKERSILSVHGNQKDNQPSTEKFQPIQEKTSFNFPPDLKSSTGDLLMKNAQKNFEDLCQKSTLEAKNNNMNIYCLYTSTCELLDSNLENTTKNNSQIKIINFSKQNLLESKGKLTSASSLSQNQLFQQNPVVERNSREPAHSRNLFLWEKDIRRYREIVKDIMSQYKRIDGFLKQSECLETFSNKSDHCFDNGESSEFFQVINLQEYRRKIVSEYQTLPFFEYKQLKRDEDIRLEEAKKRNLSVVSDINKELDFDVKDYQPKIKKVLDSQLYVDKETLFKQNDPEKKLKDKNSSLQEMVLRHGRGVFKNYCLKSYSLPKTFLLAGNVVCSLQPNNRRQKC